MSKTSDALEAAAVAFVRSPTKQTFSVLAQAARDFVASERPAMLGDEDDPTPVPPKKTRKAK